MDKTNATAIQLAADQVGVPAIANACGVSVQAVYKWIKKGYPPVERCEPIERATGGKVNRFKLLPPTFRTAVS